MLRICRNVLVTGPGKGTAGNVQVAALHGDCVRACNNRSIQNTEFSHTIQHDTFFFRGNTRSGTNVDLVSVFTDSGGSICVIAEIAHNENRALAVFGSNCTVKVQDSIASFASKIILLTISSENNAISGFCKGNIFCNSDFSRVVAIIRTPN